VKRMIKNHLTVTFELNIDIVCSSYSSVLSSTDLTGTEYDSFIVSMMAQFDNAGYSVSHNEDYTHSSNTPGSLSEYFTFTKWIGDVQILVLVNVRLSDHPDVARGQLKSQMKRARYVARLGQELSEGHDAQYVATYPLDIVFDDQHFRSFSSAQFQIHSRLNKIDKEVNEIIQENNLK